MTKIMAKKRKYAVKDLHVLLMVSLLYEKKKIYKYALNLNRVFNRRKLTFIQKANSYVF